MVLSRVWSVGYLAESQDIPVCVCVVAASLRASGPGQQDIHMSVWQRRPFRLQARDSKVVAMSIHHTGHRAGRGGQPAQQQSVLFLFVLLDKNCRILVHTSSQQKLDHVLEYVVTAQNLLARIIGWKVLDG
jgi:hypothetical protein